MKTFTHANFSSSSSSSSSLYLWFLFASFLCTMCSCNQSSDHVLCIPTERLVLIQFKNNLVDGANRLSSWSGNDCCRWSGVVCDNFTGHVHKLHLRGPDDGIHGHCHGPSDTDLEFEEAQKQMLRGTITPSLKKLEQLVYLDLSCNDFGLTPIPAFIGSFKNLRYLNISMSQFEGEVPRHLGNLSMLHVLDIHDIPLSSNLHSKNLKWVENLKRLQYLDMSNIDLTGASDWLQVISTLPSLQELRCSLCGLTQIPSDPTRVTFTTSLKVLDLSYNIFNSLVPGWIFSLRNLVSLDLTNCFLLGLNPGAHGGFDSMPSLETLFVSSNTFVNSSLILKGLFSLSNLSRVDVSNCNLTDPILGKLQNLSLIVHLDLSNNQIVEKMPKSLSNLCNLITLDLQSNNFSGDVSELLENFCECESPKLELLALRGNYVTGRLPEKLGRLKNLGSIDIAYNQLTGIIPGSLGKLSLLKTFQLNVNQLEGPIPDSVGDLSSLNFLDLSFNKLNGSLPESIGKLGKLTFLTLHHNSLTGIVTEDHFANLTALKTLWIGDNKFLFNLNVKRWIPPFQLDVLRIGSCGLGPLFPSWVQSQTNLAELDLSNANISDTIPNWIWSTFVAVMFLNISHNNIVGKLGDVSFLTPGAKLDLSGNHFHGPLPSDFNKLDFLDLSSNDLSGSLDKFLCSGVQESRMLTVLILEKNNMSGGIPDCWMNWEALVILNLENNKFSGTIPSSLGNLSSLSSINMRNNKLSGGLQMSLLNSKSLLILELAENELTGRIPISIRRKNASLKILSLRSNKLSGEIPDELCHLSSIQILDLADNGLSGNLPTCFTNFSVISGRKTPTPIVLYDTLFQNQVLGSASLVTKGRVNSYSSILYLVTTLDLSVNNFSGSIPNELMALTGLRYLNLSQNQLTGRISDRISEMRQLESLDLSLNHLNGKIPLSLSMLTSLNSLNLSYNNLTGRIPTGPQLQTFNESSFIGNALCGAPLAACQPNSGDTDQTDENFDESDDFDWILLIFIAVGLVVGFWITIGPLLVSEQWRDTYFHFLDNMEMKLQDFSFLICPCFKTHKPPQGMASSIDQLQPFNSSIYVFDQPGGFQQHNLSYEASSSTQPVQQSDLSY